MQLILPLHEPNHSITPSWQIINTFQLVDYSYLVHSNLAKILSSKLCPLNSTINHLKLIQKHIRIISQHNYQVVK